MGRGQGAVAIVASSCSIRYSWAATTIALLLAPSISWAQGCCTPGSSPLGGLSGGALHRGQLEIGVAIEGFNLHQGYEGSAKVQDPARRQSRVLSTTAYARLGLSNRIAVIVQLPYEYRERTAPAIPETGQPGHDFSNTAIGDLATIVMAQVLPLRGPSPFALNVGVGMKWATGSDDNTQDGLRLPVELQTGTGSNDPLLTLVAYRLWSWGSASANSVVRLPRRGHTGYRYGQEVNYAVTVLWSLGTAWQLGPEVRGRTAARDDFRDFVRENTGGSRVTVGPRVVYSLPGALVLEGSFLFPVWQDLNDLQLGVSEGASFGIRWRLI